MRWIKYVLAGCILAVLVSLAGFAANQPAIAQQTQDRQALSSAIGSQVTIALGRPEATASTGGSGANSFSGVSGKLVSFDDQWLVVEMPADNQFDHIWVERSRVIYVGSKRGQ